MQEVSEALHFDRTTWTAFWDGGFHLLNVGGLLDHHALCFGRTKVNIRPDDAIAIRKLNAIE